MIHFRSLTYTSVSNCNAFVNYMLYSQKGYFDRLNTNSVYLIYNHSLHTNINKEWHFIVAVQLFQFWIRISVQI